MINLRKAINDVSERYDLAIAEAKSDKVALVLLREKKRFLCRNDLFYLCKITGNDKIAENPEYYEPFCDEVSLMNWQVVRKGIQPKHPEMLKIEDVTDTPDEDLKFVQRLYLAYRTFYKTTIISKVHSLQLLLNFPNIHFPLVHNKQENASDNLVAIKNYFLTTEIGKLFPEYIPEGKEWGNMSGFSVAVRTDWGRTEENIEAIGVDTEITGRHWQLAKKNDLVTDKSVNTEEQIRKTLEWDERFNIGHFDNPETPLQDYEGTRYHFADRYSTLKNNPNVKLIEIPLLKDGNPQNLTVENISNPKRFTPDGVKMMQADMWTFMCQHILKPEDPERMQFKMEMIQYFGVIPDCNYYLLVDPASKRKKRSDFTSMIVVGVDSENNKYIVDGVRDKLNPKQRIDLAISLALKWAIKGCGWEAIAFQETDCYYLEEERRKQRIFFTLTEIKSHVVSKEDRIRSLVPEYSLHKWFWPGKGSVVKYSFYNGRNYDLTEEMEFEFIQFPLCEHDDLLDTMSFLNKLSIIIPQKIEEIEDKPMTFADYHNLIDERKASVNENIWNRLYAYN